MHSVRFDPAADTELNSLFDFILAKTGSVPIAEGYIRRIVQHCLLLSTFPERGLRRDDIRPGLRTIGFERRVTIAFVVEEQWVTILRVLYGGRQLEGDR